ncbi:MAG: hypothetical protein KAG89_06085 [Fulvimarina manganoxydans]|uniref:hypothetical protein n=1 Tax=Fulvimarina manganoxydans TaxID=937218 RepID=UPI002355109D|nr:hypothetical protein [Fulvimarina manganoxydans]MCK5931723.1 hypothetical protein [Fulvimarina manganoxydans]
MKALLIATALGAMAATPSFADELFPQTGRTFELGGVNGSIYYTADDQDFRVVTTVGAEGASPMRHVAFLRDGQSLRLEVPGKAGSASRTLVIERLGDRLHLAPGADLRASLVLD